MPAALAVLKVRFCDKTRIKNEATPADTLGNGQLQI